MVEQWRTALPLWGKTSGFITVVSSQLGTNPLYSTFGGNFHFSLLSGFPKSPEVVSYHTRSFPSSHNMILHFIFVIVGFKRLRHNGIQSREDTLGALFFKVCKTPAMLMDVV